MPALRRKSAPRAGKSGALRAPGASGPVTRRGCAAPVHPSRATPQCGRWIGASPGCSCRRAFGGVLQAVQARVSAVEREELRMAAALDDAAPLEHHDAIGALDGREEV